MAVSDTDLLLVQRGAVPYKTTATDLASYTNTKIELGDGKDVPIASASRLGVIKVGANLDITGDGTLSAVIPAGLTYKGPWTNANNPPAPAFNGDFYIWDGADGTTLNNALWGISNGEIVNEGDRLFYDGNSWTIIGSGGGGLTQITGTSPVLVSGVVDGEQNVSMPASTALNDGYMPKEAWAKLDGSLMSLVAGDGISINTTVAPGSASTPEVKVKFAGTGADDTTLVMPANIALLEDLP